METLRTDIRDIFDCGLDAANPREAIRRNVILRGDCLAVGERTYNLCEFEGIFIVGAGKASAAMAQALEEILGDRIRGGEVITKYNYGLSLQNVSIHEAAHPVPDEAGIRGTERILNLLGKCGEKDIVFCLISGGGSALMPLPAGGLSLADKQGTTQELLKCGATIHEINTIRKHISGIKGGRLARAAYPATLVTLVLSDVIGDNLDVIASGPTVPDRSSFEHSLRILEKYDIIKKVPSMVIDYLMRGKEGREPETPKDGDPVFDRAYAIITGSSRLSINAARDRALELGYNTLILSSYVEGETREVARVHAAIIKEIIATGNPAKRPACIISGGETTVTIKGDGIGGRNMEFVLAAAIEMDDMKGVALLSGGTDGTDGPTDSAGAIADGTTIKRAEKMGHNAEQYLERNDSYNFFKAIGDLLMTGPTMTNVMDLRIILVV
ncbi:MAG: glycerate kinase [Deltaproteobacteria bacterium]|nr:glycerate kinase [Deltaproteobacteria bacterium]